MSSKHICLQNILFDNLGIPDETKPLFIRPGRIQNGNNVSAERSSIILPAGTKLDLNTYFNNFTYRKWMEWCFIEGVSLQFTYSGDLVVEVFSTAGCRRKQISSLQLTGSGRAVIPILAENDPQLLSVVLHTRTESRIADAGWYGVPSFPENRRSIAIVICTYKRMDYLKNTLAVLREHLPAGWQVLTVDNDSSITDEFRANYDTRFAFFNNPNTGGSGGFTRGLIEAIARKCTHAVLMDDDISLDPEALQRTDSLLALLRPEYSTRFIAGAMFRMDKPSIQHESTAVWNGIKVHSQKHNLDMTKKRSICRNEKPDRRTQRYAGWWYCGIPLTKGIEHDLPFP
ncbi:MAG: glycosyltransferase, partial [Spirochaetales bacterium]|nr:glycosyltransferase [Spirochaetales bacterium]